LEQASLKTLQSRLQKMWPFFCSANPITPVKKFFAHCKKNKGENFRKFKGELKVLLDEAEATDDGVDPKLKFLIVEEVHVIVVFIPMGGTRKFVYPITLRVTMAYLHVKALFNGGILQVWMPKDGNEGHPELESGGNSEILAML
jgi:hypothetical protein